MKLFGISFVAFVWGMAFGGFIESRVSSEVRHLRTEAVERGHAEWLVNQKDGTTKWQWKELKSVP